ncbi:uncharacterized protein LOC9659714 isoform X1 [Selaginella moellendorffii]|nr:uncharacterized protein LOC9659714 isoform X1 [Selaginella moellendorffii]|eukprot:XP_024529888.1 uncharacterized protein LOC9659714 isoform X1 [Selaginella moellendorffii]
MVLVHKGLGDLRYSFESRNMKFELSYHSFLLVLLVVVGVYTVLTMNGSTSFQLYRPTPAPDCTGEISRRGGIKTETPTGGSLSAAENLEAAPAAAGALPLKARATDSPSPRTTLANIVFGLAAGFEVWDKRKGYIQAWWRPEMRGAVWLDKMVARSSEDNLPPLMVSEDTSRFNYTYSGPPNKRQKQQLRMCRTAVEMFRLRLPDVHWFVVGDDDTVFLADNVARVLSKYDHTKFYYIGGISETHRQNTVDGCCTGNMAYGGAGYAISYPLVEELSEILDECMERYADLYGGSSRIHACLLELGVPLIKEPGFHQLDINGDASGILGAHPIAPLLSLHHLDRIDPLFPGMSRQKSVEHLLQAAGVDPGGVLQQAVCYSKQQSWSIQVSWGWAVQVTRLLLAPRVLENPLRTFAGWGVPSLDESFGFRTRAVPRDSCERPTMFFMHTVVPQRNGQSFSNYSRGGASQCRRKDALSKINLISVEKQAVHDSWYQAPRRQCCKIIKSSKHTLELSIRTCQKGELSAIL